VTYKWLSYTLGVHVNQAKQMLYDYVERKRKENSGAQLHVTYLVAGNLIQNGHVCHKVAVVREDKLEAMKSKLATIASVHVYSIQKALLKDSGPLYNTDYDIVKTNLHNCSK
ncbi:PREDICTED: DNA polymerase delta subunit 3-like, partial [Phaethon lepturus]